MNTIRLRVFVNPSNKKASGHCSKKETVEMALRVQKMGMRVIGGDYTKVQNTYDMLVEVINAVKAVPERKGLGVIYWEPQGAKSWSH